MNSSPPSLEERGELPGIWGDGTGTDPGQEGSLQAKGDRGLRVLVQEMRPQVPWVVMCFKLHLVGTGLSSLASVLEVWWQEAGLSSCVALRIHLPSSGTTSLSATCSRHQLKAF